MIWIVLVSGVFNVCSALVMNTKNVLSAVFFKVIPFFLGLGCLLYSLKQINIF